MKRKCLPVFFCLLLLLSHTAAAMDTEAVLAHNRAMREQWVSFLPAAWERDAAVASLSAALAAEGDLPVNIHDWVCANIRYDWDAFEAGTYTALSPSDVLAARRGVCEGIANLVQALFLEAGVPCVKVWGAAITPEQSWEDWDTERINHTWNEYYWDGQWVSMDCTMDLGEPVRQTYLAPAEDFFAQTHLVLRRGENLPEDIPDKWAMEAVQAAADRVPLAFLCRYREPVTEAEWLALLGRTGGEARPLTRLEAALVLAGGQEAAVAPYSDTQHLPLEVQGKLAALYEQGVFRGSGGRFEPDRPLTRQEALAVLVRLAGHRS